RAEAAVLGRAVAKTVVLGRSGVDEESIDTEIENAVRIFEGVLGESAVEVEINPRGFTDSPVKIPVASDTQVSQLLNEIWFELRGAVEPYTYGKTWMLTDRVTGKAYIDIGRSWARIHGIPEDSRLISEVGIKPGSLLKATIMPDISTE
ncbi:MAG: hypothetical protein ACRDP7_46410, partial [Trebonia sp.]